MAAARGRGRGGRGRGALPPGYGNLPAKAAPAGSIGRLGAAAGMGQRIPAPAAAMSGGTPAPAGRGQGGRGQRAGVGGGGNSTGVGGASLPGPGGRQLQARVQSGQITQAQAKQTMMQRQTLAKALGPNWRDKLQVGGTSFAQVNRQLKANPGNARLAAIRKKLLANRSTLLDRAREKNSGGKQSTEGQE